jgi:hypothetical protein
MILRRTPGVRSGILETDANRDIVIICGSLSLRHYNLITSIRHADPGSAEEVNSRVRRWQWRAQVIQPNLCAPG